MQYQNLKFIPSHKITNPTYINPSPKHHNYFKFPSTFKVFIKLEYFSNFFLINLSLMVAYFAAFLLFLNSSFHLVLKFSSAYFFFSSFIFYFAYYCFL